MSAILCDSNQARSLSNLVECKVTLPNMSSLVPFYIHNLETEQKG